jgi:hypothetical protein
MCLAAQAAHHQLGCGTFPALWFGDADFGAQPARPPSVLRTCGWNLLAEDTDHVHSCPLLMGLISAFQDIPTRVWHRLVY